MENRYIAVIKINENQSRSLECIDLYDVDFIETDKNRRVVLHVGSEQFYLITTKSDLDSFLLEEGFDVLDRTNLVNLRKVRKFDEDYGKVYFEENPTSSSKYATVARVKYKYVTELLRRIISYNNDTTTEVKIKGRSFVTRLRELLH